MIEKVGCVMPNRYTNILVGPHQVAIDITNNCNLRCLHCYNSSGENDVLKQELSDEEISNFVKSLCDMKIYSLCLCGGEPLLRKNLVFKCIKLLNEHDVKCSMVTNGILATDDVLDQLDKLGLNAIQFSLDGLEQSHDKLRNREGVFQQVTNAIEYVIKHTKLHLSIAFCPTTFNINDFIKVYDMLEDLFLNSQRNLEEDYIELRCQPLMILGRAKKHKNIIPTERQYRELVSIIHKLEVERNSKIIQVIWGDPVDHLIKFRNVNNLLDQLTIHANGDIVVSAYLPLVVGNIRRYSLKEYWDRGLNRVWSTKIVQFLVSKMLSIKEMEEITNIISDINMDSVLYIDLIENDLDDINLIKNIVDKME